MKRKAARGTIRQVSAGEPLLTYQQSAERLGVSVRALYELAKAGIIPHVRIGRKVFFTEGFLLDYINQCVRGKV